MARNAAATCLLAAGRARDARKALLGRTSSSSDARFDPSDAAAPSEVSPSRKRENIVARAPRSRPARVEAQPYGRDAPRPRRKQALSPHAHRAIGHDGRATFPRPRAKSSDAQGTSSSRRLRVTRSRGPPTPTPNRRLPSVGARRLEAAPRNSLAFATVRPQPLRGCHRARPQSDPHRSGHRGASRSAHIATWPRLRPSGGYPRAALPGPRQREANQRTAIKRPPPKPSWPPRGPPAKPKKRSRRGTSGDAGALTAVTAVVPTDAVHEKTPPRPHSPAAPGDSGAAVMHGLSNRPAVDEARPTSRSTSTLWPSTARSARRHRWEHHTGSS